MPNKKVKGFKKNKSKPIWVIIFTLVLIFAAALYLNSSSSSIKRENVDIDISKIEIDKFKTHDPSTIIYTKATSSGHDDFFALNLKNNSIKKLLNKNQLINQEKLIFSPALNYILSFDQQSSGKLNDYSSTYLLKIHDMEFKNAHQIVKIYAPNAAFESMDPPTQQSISDDGNSLIISTLQPKFEHEPDSLGNRGKLIGNIRRIYFLDLVEKKIKKIEEEIYNEIRVVGWKDNKTPIILLEDNLKIFDSKDEKVFQLSSSIDNFLYTPSKNLIVYQILPLEQSSTQLLQFDLNNGKKIILDELDGKKGIDGAFSPLLFSKEGNKLLVKKTVSNRNDTLDKSNTKVFYVVYDLNKNIKTEISDPEQIITEFNKEKYGYAWYGACDGDLNFIKNNNVIADSHRTSVFGCGQLSTYFPNLFITPEDK